MQTLDHSTFSETVVKPVLTQLVDTRNTYNVKAVGIFHPQYGETVVKRPLRLFVSGTGEYARLAYYRKGSRKRGYDIDDLRSDGLFELHVKTKQKNKSLLDEYCDRLSKFKKAFMKDCHPNLWQSLRDSYTRLDIADFKAFAERFMAMQPENDRFHYYEALCEYRKLHNLDLITENCYKRTTLVSNKQKWDFGGEAVKGVVERLQKAIEKKEDFSESWEGNYDVSVSTKLCADGSYKGWLSLEFRGCGNGHYYLLLNSNSAIFSESD